MNKRLKQVLISVIVISLLTILVVLTKLSSRLPENPIDYAGNTAGNLYNRGLFAEDDTYIYFANTADAFRLYRATHDLEEITRLSKDSVEYINPDATASNIYYSRISYRQNLGGNTAFDLLDTGIYRFDTQNEVLSRLYPNACGMVLLGGNRLFYQTHGDDGNYDLYSLSVSTKKSEATRITTDYIQPANYRSGLLYHSGVTDDHGLHVLNPETGSSALFADLDCFQPILTDTGTYFLSLKHNYSLFYLPNTSDAATLISNNRISSYNLSKDETVLFYQIDGGKNNRLCRYDLADQTESVILSGNYKNLNTVSDYLFFTDFHETVCYCYDIAKDNLFAFMPTASE